MKYLIVMIVALAASVTAEEEWKPISDPYAFTKIYDDCKRETGITADQLERIINGEYPTENNVRDYVLCPVVRLGVFTEDKGFNLDRMMAQLEVFGRTTDSIRDHLAGCIDNNEQKSSAAEWAFRGQHCMVKDKFRQLSEMQKNPSKPS